MKDGKFRIIIVCTGNTCRSPMAEGILKSILDHRGEDGIIVSSAGISGMDSYPAASNAIEAAKHWNIDISGHRARSLTEEMIADADLLLAMSSEHVEFILKADSSAVNKTFLMKAFPKPYSPAQERVDDPIGGLLDQYNRTFLELDDLLRQAEGEILKLANAAKKDS